MITKERLQELIEQGATIYDLFKGDIYLIDLTKAKYWKDVSYIEYFNQYYKCNITRNNNDLFETEEDALWELEMTATRTETLKMPTYENFLKDNFGIRFYNKSREFCLHKVRYSADDNNPQWRLNLYESYGDEWDTVAFEKEWDLTKENYIEACKLCLKLFMGER